MAKKLHTVKTKLNLLVRLTEKELMDHARNMADAVSKMKEAQDRLDSFKSQVKAEMERYQAEINVASDKVNRGEEYRMVDAECQYDFAAGVKTYIRLDTLMEVRKETITDEERQRELALEEKQEEKTDGKK